MSAILNSVMTPSFLYSIIRVATPLILASLGAVITSNAGITNIGIEGVMLISALVWIIDCYFDRCCLFACYWVCFNDLKSGQRADLHRF